MADKVFLAIDIGASSGRHIVGIMKDGKLQTREVYRFPNRVKNENGSLVWDLDSLFNEVKAGIKMAFLSYPQIESLSIDTWGVDYVLFKGEKEVLPAYSYRDLSTADVVETVHSIIPFERLYSITGSQFQQFNTIYQLYRDKQQGRLEGVSHMMMIPEYLMFKLTGVYAREYTNATTTGLIDANSGTWSEEIISDLNLPGCLFPELQKPGTYLGRLLPEISLEVGGNCSVVLCATHDTASAVEGIPMSENAPYISSGTWSLLGVKTKAPICTAASQRANFSNEGGVNYNRYQKNIMGMWLVNRLREEICPNMRYAQIVPLAQDSTCSAEFDANSLELLSPDSMKEAFDKLSKGTLKTVGDYFKCAYLNLANGYKQALSELEENTGTKYDSLYIVGGGANNGFLNYLTEQATGKKVYALPIEASALGNLKIQIDMYEREAKL